MELGPHVSLALALLALLNPFLMSLCLPERIADLPRAALLRMLVRSALVSAVVLSLFAWGGDAVFSDALQVRFASFQVFVGLILLAIGVRYVFKGSAAMRAMGGEPERIAGSISLPLMIGPGTVSGGVMVGALLPVPDAIGVIFATLAVTVGLLAAIRFARDTLAKEHARLADRGIEIAGRVTALVIGTFAVEMIFEGIGAWLEDPAPQWRA